MAQAMVQAIRELVRRTGQATAPTQKSSAWKKMAVRTVLLILAAVFFSYANPFIRISCAEEREEILSDSGIIYPGGYDLNTVGDIQGKVKAVLIPESGPVRIILIVDKETYTVLASPGWFWKNLETPIAEGMDVVVRGSKTVGIDGNLYIIAQKITVSGTNKTLALRSESGKALWSGGYQKGLGSQGNGYGSSSGGFGSSSGGFGSSSGGHGSGGSSGRGRGR